MTKTRSLFLSSQRDGTGTGEEWLDLGQIRSEQGQQLTDGLNVKRERKKCDKDVPSWAGILL